MTLVHRILPVVGAAAALALAVGLYWPGLSGSFFFDDEANVLNPEGLHMSALAPDAIRDAWNSGISGPLGRPIAQLSFALNHFLGGSTPWGFKVTNLAIHLLVGCLIFLTSRRLLANAVAAWIATALWLVHPIQLTSVLYVVQRMTSLSALFLLAGFFLHMVGRERGGRLGAGLLLVSWTVLWPLSCLSKESGLLFPLFVLAWEALVRARAWSEMDRFARILAVGTGACLLVGAIYAVLPSGQWMWAGYSMRPFTLAERLLTEGRVLWLYLGLIVFPRLDTLGLYHDDLPLSTGLFDPWTTLTAWVGLAGLGAAAWFLRSRAPLVSFGFAWFLIGHALESTVLPLEIAHEHRNYLPSFGIALAAAWGFSRLIEHAGWRRTLAVAGAICALTYLSLVTALRAHQFGDEVRRTQIESQHHPLSARAHYDAGRALASRLADRSASSPQYYLARTHFERAAEIDPDLKYSWLGLIYLNCLVGKSAETVWLDQLADRLRNSPFAAGDRLFLYAIKEMAVEGTICLPRSDIERLFASAVANATVSPGALAVLHSWHADYLTLGAHDLPAARSELDKALQIAPYNPGNRLKQAQLAYLLGSPAEASGILDALNGIRLSGADAKMMQILRTCIATKCTLKRD